MGSEKIVTCKKTAMIGNTILMLGDRELSLVLVVNKSI